MLPEARFAVGEPAAGISGFRATHRQALQARRVASLSGHAAGTLTRYRSIALSSIATADLDQAEAFVQDELGGLAGSDDTSVRIAATVQVFLEEGSSQRRTARRLGIHENTVRYRIEQAEQKLARPIDQRTLELRVALTLLNIVRNRRSAADRPT
jgi:DNA-binding PucR family transcriptional regulator